MDNLVNRTMGPSEWLLIILLSFLWGGSFFFIEITIRELTPLTVVLGRVGLAAAVLLLVVYATGRRMPHSGKIWGAFLVMGFINNLIPFSLIVWGQTHIDSSLAAILNATTPIFSVILAHFLTQGEERLTRNRMMGILLGWTGVTVLIGVESLKSFGINILGQLAILVASFSYACAAIYGRRFRGLSPIVVAAGMLCGTTLMMTPLALIIEQPWELTPGMKTIVALLCLAILNTSLAYIIYFRVLASAGPTNILLVTFLVPLSAILLAVLVLREKPGWNAIGGMALIFAGLVAIDGRLISRGKADYGRRKE